MCTRCGPVNLTVKQKTKKKAICCKLLACFEAEGQACLSRVVTADESWVHHSGNKKAIHTTPPSSIYMAKKNSRNLPSPDKTMISVMWDCKGVILVDKNAARGDNKLWCPHQDVDRTQEAFQNSLASQESNRNIASIWQCNFADSGSHHKLCLGSVTTSTIQQSQISTHLESWRMQSAAQSLKPTMMMMMM